MEQCLASMSSILILVRNACSYKICMHSAVVIQLPTLMTNEYIEYYNIWKLQSLCNCVGEVGTTGPELMNAAMAFCVALYSQSHGTSMESAHFNMFTKKTTNYRVNVLPPTSSNLLQHILLAHLYHVRIQRGGRGSGPPPFRKNYKL